MWVQNFKTIFEKHIASLNLAENWDNVGIIIDHFCHHDLLKTKTKVK